MEEPSTSSAVASNANTTSEASTSDTVTTQDEQYLNEMLYAEEFLSKRNAISMLPFQKQMFLDLIYADGLLVCAKGISYNSVIINLLKAHSDAGNLVLVINSAEYEEKYIKSHFDASEIHESSTNAKERESRYLLGGIHFLTTRILVVDLLKKRIPIELITGIIVLRAHKIIESCQEAFALRLYRQHNKTGFIKAFSSSSEAFTYGYGHVEKVMRNIFVKELFIWPRFHVTIQKILKAYEPQVIELHVPMTSKMVLIQTNILDIMNFLVKEIKRINRHFDMQEIVVENCITKKFHKILQSQLDCVWHQLSAQTKLLVADLRVLRTLMFATIYNDAVSLYVLLKKYRSQTYAMNNSGWILSDAAEQLFKLSKERVFNSSDEFEPEACPKWKVLSEILSVEIPNDIRRQIHRKAHSTTDPIKVLILCNDSRTCYQLSQILTQGPERHLYFTAMKNDVALPKISELYKNIQNADDVIDIQSVAKAKEVPVIAVPIKTPVKESAVPRKGGFLRDRIAKRKELEESAEFGNGDEDGAGEEAPKDGLAQLGKEECFEDGLFRDTYVLTMTQTMLDGSLRCQSEETEFDVTLTDNNIAFETFAELDNLDVTQLMHATTRPVVCIQTFKSSEDSELALERTLNELKPGFVIMYHCNITAIRQIEVYETMQKRDYDNRLKVFFLLHSQTVEEQSYLTSLRREKNAFDLLIDTKSKMVVPEYQDGKSDEMLIMLKKTTADDDLLDDQEVVAKVAVTPKIIVDMREFRSELPCLIHKRGIEVVPVTITIGDYILTPDICVERKSISDLIGSLNSGRLYNQCVQMLRYYKKPILLIEFDKDKPFHLQGHYMIASDAPSANVDITQKLQLLTIYFPKLRLVWSPSPYATAQLFEELKQNRDEPDGGVAASLGSDDQGTKDLENIVDKMNVNIHDFLIKLPGITSKNIAMLMRKVADFKELLKLSQVELAAILGSENNAKMLFEILHVAHKPVQADKNEKVFISKFKRGKRF